jgi:hypothetical protein
MVAAFEADHAATKADRAITRVPRPEPAEACSEETQAAYDRLVAEVDALARRLSAEKPEAGSRGRTARAGKPCGPRPSGLSTAPAGDPWTAIVMTPGAVHAVSLDIGRPAMPPLTPEEREATRKACALTIARHEKALTSYRTMEEIMLVARAATEQARDFMAWADAVLKGARIGTLRSFD